MTDDIGKGDFVERVAPNPCCCSHCDWMVQGRVFEVVALDPDPVVCVCCGEAHPWLVFPQDKPGDGWCPTFFRKLYRPDPEKLKRQLTGKVDGPEQPKRKAKRPLLIPDDMVVEMGR